MATTVAQAKAAIYSQLASAPIFHPSTADLFTDFTVESGDIYTVSSDSTSYSVPVYGMKLKWNGSSKVEVQNSGNVQRDPVEKMAQKKSRRGGRSYMNGNIVEDQIAGVRSTVTQLSNSWSVVVEGTGQNQHIKPAVIQASINAATGSSKITLSADNIELDGDTFASYFTTNTITVDELVGNGISVDNATIIYDDGLFVGEQTMLVADVYKDPNDANTIIVVKTDGTSFSFSKATSTSLSGSWSGNVFTVLASPQGNDYDLGFGTNYGSHDKDFEVVVKASSIAKSSIANSIDIPLAINELQSGQTPPAERYTRTATANIAGLLQSKTVTPTSSQQTVTPDNAYIGLSSVVVEAGGGGSGTITSVACTDGPISGDTNTRSTLTVRASGTNVSPFDQGYTVASSLKTVGSGSSQTKKLYAELREGTGQNPSVVGRILMLEESGIGVTYSSDSPSPNRYTMIDKKNGDNADLKMGFVVTAGGVERTVSYQAPVSYAYRNGYIAGRDENSYGDGYKAAARAIVWPGQISGQQAKSEISITYPNTSGGTSTYKYTLSRDSGGAYIMHGSTLVARVFA